MAAVLSRGPVRDLIHHLKYRRAAWAARPLAELACEGWPDPRIGSPPALVVPVPLHPLRLRERGYNQAALLATEVGKRTGLPVREPLRRLRATQSQTGFDRKERMRNLRGAFALRKNADVSGIRILLVDDVLTTGSTLDACARVLLAAGAGPVYALVAARG
jgi:ComF family protein